MLRLKQIQDKSKRGQVDQAAAKRFITSGLWKPGEAKKQNQKNVQERNKRQSDAHSQSQSSKTASDIKKPKLK